MVRAAAPPLLTSEEALQQAQEEGLTLLGANSTTGYFGVTVIHHSFRPYKAQVSRGGKGVQVHLGYFATAEEAALSVARSMAGEWWAMGPKRRRLAATTPLANEELQRHAQHMEGMTLLGEAALCDMALRVARSLEGHGAVICGA